MNYRIWPVSFMDYDLGNIDLEEKTLQLLNHRFGVNHVSGTFCKGPSGLNTLRSSRNRGESELRYTYRACARLDLF